MLDSLGAEHPVIHHASFIGPLEMVLLLVLVLIVFGANRLPQLGEALGRSIKGFKKAVTDEENRAIDVTPAKKELAGTDVKSEIKPEMRVDGKAP